jgi:hypothetical protein
MTDQTEPIRRSELPSTPPPEWEFHTWFPHPDGGGDMVPGQRQRGVVVRRRVSYSDWEPVRPDRWADEPETDTRAAAPAGPAPATNQTALECAADIAEDVALRLRNECLLDQVNGAYEVMAELRRLAGEAQQDERCAHPHGRPGIASLMEHVGIDTSGGVTVDGQTVAAPCTCGGRGIHHLHADDHQPAREAQQDPTQDGEDVCSGCRYVPCGNCPTAMARPGQPETDTTPPA